MSQTLTIVFSVVLVLLTIVLSVVGVQMILVLMEVRRTMKKINLVLDQAETKINNIIAPLQSLGGMASGLQAGFQVFESFVGWLNRRKNDK